jgi:rare lipoprotein A
MMRDMLARAARRMKKLGSARSAIVASIFCLAVVAGCHKKNRTARIPAAPPPQTNTATRSHPSMPPPKPVAVPVGYTEEGIASWYGIPYHGRAAADGEIYDMETLVAAHRLIPFNTWLLVTNLSNNKSVKVRVIDRGPFVEGRILDLSKAAARQIELLGPGIGRVRLEVIAAPLDIPANDFYAVQVGAFSVYANAERARSDYAARFGVAQLALKQGSTPMWRVLVGKESSVDAAQELAQTLSAQNKTVFVVRLDETVLNPAAASPATVAAPSAPTAPASDTAPAPDTDHPTSADAPPQ